MLSIFSSFDSYFLQYMKIFEIIFFMNFLNFFYKNNLIFMMLKILKNNMVSFLSSLSDCSMKKNVLFLYFFLMIFIFLSNFFSIFPFLFAHTAQLSNVVGMSLILWVSIVFYSLNLNFKGLINHLVPEGSPLVLVPVLFLIEFVSNFIRPITLTVRLVANILAGHLLLVLLSKVVFYYSISIIFYFLLMIVESFVSLIQSYIFVTLATLYYCDVK